MPEMTRKGWYVCVTPLRTGSGCFAVELERGDRVAPGSEELISHPAHFVPESTPEDLWPRSHEPYRRQYGPHPGEED